LFCGAAVCLARSAAAACAGGLLLLLRLLHRAQTARPRPTGCRGRSTEVAAQAQRIVPTGGPAASARGGRRTTSTRGPRPRRDVLARSIRRRGLRAIRTRRAVGVLRPIDASKVTTPPYYNTSVHPWALKLGGRLLLHPWAVPVASYRALGPSGARKSFLSHGLYHAPF
jgi:hypothetical protein